MHISNAYLKCISQMHISNAYLKCISQMHILLTSYAEAAEFGEYCVNSNKSSNTEEEFSKGGTVSLEPGTD